MSRFQFALCFMLLLPTICWSQSFCSKYYQVVAGNSCWSIADSQQMSLDELKNLNPGLNCDALWVGAKVCLTKRTDTPPCQKHYTLQKGDYCYKVWTQNGLSQDEFNSYNPGLNCDGIHAGKSVCIGV